MMSRAVLLLTLAVLLGSVAGCRHAYDVYRDPYTGEVRYVPVAYRTYPAYTPPAPQAVSGSVTYSNTAISSGYLYCSVCNRYYDAAYAGTGCPYCTTYTYTTPYSTPTYTYTTYPYYPYTYRSHPYYPRTRVYQRPHRHHSYRKPPPTKTPTYSTTHRPRVDSRLRDTKSRPVRIKLPTIPVIKLPTDPVSKLLDLLRKKR